jgi:hypothetical protein
MARLGPDAPFLIKDLTVKQIILKPASEELLRAGLIPALVALVRKPEDHPDSLNMQLNIILALKNFSYDGLDAEMVMAGARREACRHVPTVTHIHTHKYACSSQCILSSPPFSQQESRRSCWR